MNRVNKKVRQLGRITRAVIYTSNEVKCQLLWEFWIYNFSRRILGRVFVGIIKHIRNKCLFSGFMGNESYRGTNKSSKNRFAVHAICLSRTTIHSPWTQKKRHSFLKKEKVYDLASAYFCIFGHHFSTSNLIWQEPLMNFQYPKCEYGPFC